MKTITVSNNITLVEHIYHANNRTCIDYAVLFTHSNEQRFIGYVRSKDINTNNIDYSDYINRWDANEAMPEWIKL